MLSMYLSRLIGWNLYQYFYSPNCTLRWYPRTILSYIVRSNCRSEIYVAVLWWFMMLSYLDTVKFLDKLQYSTCDWLSCSSCHKPGIYGMRTLHWCTGIKFHLLYVLSTPCTTCIGSMARRGWGSNVEWLLVMGFEWSLTFEDLQMPRRYMPCIYTWTSIGDRTPLCMRWNPSCLMSPDLDKG
jgi:hypothetical protein